MDKKVEKMTYSEIDKRLEKLIKKVQSISKNKKKHQKVLVQNYFVWGIDNSPKHQYIKTYKIWQKK